ncbi:MAG: sodium:calcium antiporter [Gammaproteobacteria bacterium]|nr:sodium:calcium antiporter [Gammaproteobacteria bacterium]
MIVWLQFGGCVIAIGYAGVKLSIYGDVIANKTGLGSTWIGLIMLATVTSLPELATGISSVGIAGVPEIAVGDVLGSCVFNLLIIALLDLLKRDESVYIRASRGHILSAGFGILLMGIPGISILLAGSYSNLSLGHIGVYSPLIIVLYIIAVRILFRYEARRLHAPANQEPDKYPHLTLRQAVLRYLAAALMVAGAGVWLPFVAEALAHQMGWQQSFVGTLFVAFVTSLPEMVVTVAALRLGALNMAVGNLLGSNLFNILILAIDDIIYVQGPLLYAVSLSHGVTVFSAMMMTAAAIIGLLYKRESRVFKTVGWPSVFLILVYLMNTYILYTYSSESF